MTYLDHLEREAQERSDMKERRLAASRDPETRLLYKRNHDRLKRIRGSASEHQCVDGEDHPAREWAQIHGTNGDSPDDYRPMCNKHHQVYDNKWNEEERSKVSKSISSWHASLTDEQREERGRRISQGKKGKPRPPITDQARKNQIAGQRARRERERRDSV